MKLCYKRDVLRYQAAAIPYRRNEAQGLEVLLVTSRRRGRWVLPKGNRRRLMLPHRAAAMEAFEEAGVLGLIEPLPVGTYRQVKLAKDGSSVDLEVQAFALFVNTELREWPEMTVRRRRWMNLSQAESSVRDLELATLIRTFGFEFGGRDTGK
jgi:8-oxo-dGTP pyrophosphatase MutT (NUDIX family)